MAFPARVTAAYGETFNSTPGLTVATSAFNLTGGNTVLLLFSAVPGAATVTSIADTAGNTYTLIGTVTDGGGFRTYAYIKDNATGNASNVVTVTWSGNVTFRAIAAIQYSGLDTAGSLDVFTSTTSGAAGGLGRVLTTSAFSTARHDEVMVVVPRWGQTYTYFPDARPAPPFDVTAVSSGNVRWGERFLGGPRPSATYALTTTNTVANNDALIIITLQSADTATEPIILTQEVIEIVDAGSEDVRLTQEVVELVDGGTGSVRSTQEVIEIVWDTQTVDIGGAHVSATQLFPGSVEVVFVPGIFRVTQVVAEETETPVSEVLYSQSIAEIGQDPNEVQFSHVIAEAAQDPNEIRVSHVIAEAAQDPNEIRVSQIIAEIAQPNVPVPTSGDTRVTQVQIHILGNRNELTTPILGPCEGNGVVPTGINPPDGADVRNATTPLVWVDFSVSEGPPTPVYAAKVAINVSPRKPPRMLKGGHLTRGVSDSQGRMEMATAKVILNDTDRVVRGMIDTGTIYAQDATLYLADRATIEAGGVPRRLLMGKVKNFDFPDDFQVELEIEDQLAFDTSPLAGNTQIPKQLIPTDIVDATSNEEEQITSWPTPLCYGALTDEEEESPIGVVPTKFTEQTSIYADFGLSNMDLHLICLGAIKNIQSAYCADWITGGDSPTTRMRVPDEAWGDWIFAPTMPGWPAPDPWFESNGRRWTVIMSRQEHPASVQAREGRIPFTVNLCGYEEIGDGSGEMIASLPRQWVHFLTNFVFNDYNGTGNWQTAIPILGASGYSAIDTESVEATKLILDARAGVQHDGAFILGHSNNQVDLDDVLTQFNRNMGCDSYINKNGQLALVALDRTDVYASAVTLGQRRDIATGVKFNPRSEEVENTIDYGYARRYHRLLAETTADENLRVREPKDTKFMSGTISLPDAPAIAAMAGLVKRSRLQEYDMIRVQEIAESLAQNRLDWYKRPRFQAEVPLVDYYAADMELGDVVKVTHEQGITATGWTNRRCQIRRLTIDADDESSSLTVRDVENLLP